MKRLTLFSIVTSFLFLLTACNQSAAEVNFKDPSAIVIDTRTPEEWASGHLKSAELVDYRVIAQGVEAMNVDKDSLILLYCRSGNRSGQAKTLVEAMGYTNVINAGGVADASALLNELVVK